MMTNSAFINLRRGIAMGAMAVAIVSAPGAMAQTAREAELEARLNQLEAAVSALRSELTQARSEQQTSTQIAQKADSRVAALEAKPASDGFKVGATTFKLGGFVKVVGSATRYDDGAVPGGSLGKEFYLPQQIPVGGQSSRDIIGHARQTRLSFSTSTPLGGKEIKSPIRN